MKQTIQKFLFSKGHASLFLRGTALAAKFMLFIFLADNFSAEVFGEFGIFFTSITLSLYLVGLDFYTYSSREMLENGMSVQNTMLRDQFLFYIANYVVFFPLLSILFITGTIDTTYIIYFYSILLLEHLGQEAYRVLIIFSKPIAANILLFIRTGAWCYALILLLLLGYTNLITIELVFLFWIAGGLLTLLCTIYFFRIYNLQLFVKGKVNVHWIKKGLQVCMLFFLATAGYKVIDLADRYILQAYHSKTEAGVYVFYANISNLVETVVFTAVITIYTPQLIALFSRDEIAYRKLFKKFTKQVYFYTLITAICAMLVVYFVILRMQTPRFTAAYGAFVLLVTGKAVLNISYIYHYILYVRRKDHTIVISTLAAALLNIILNFILIPKLHLNGAAIATISSLTVLLFIKYMYAKKYPEWAPAHHHHVENTMG
jgi:O-antigen/teichoic acid export membrane protein